jgi:O-antigen/teichoic acid export membrane protein
VEIASRALKGIFWSYASYFWRQLLTAVSIAVLARLLVPEDFGLVAFALIIMTFIESTRGFGINDALIYITDKVEETAETAFLINIAIGLAQFILAYLLAPYMVHFFDDARIVDVLRIIALSFVFDGFGKTHDALLRKDLKFRKSAVPEIIATSVKIVVSIVLALLHFGVWSIVLGQIIGHLAQTLAKWWALRWLPRLRFSFDRARALWQYGVHIMTSMMLNVVLEMADQSLIGTMAGQLQLGYYSIGARLPEIIIANFSLILSKALFPTYAKFTNDLARMRTAYLTTVKYTALITVPAGIGMVAVAPDLVLTVFGSQWEPAIPVLRVLALLGMVATLQWSIGDVFKAMGKPGLATILLLTEALYTFPLIYWFTASTRLAVMASLANLIALTIATVIRMIVVSRLLDIRLKVFVELLYAPFTSAVVMFVVLYGWQNLANSIGLPMLVVLILSILIGAVVYLACIWLIDKNAIVEARDTLLAIVRGKRGDKEIDATEPEVQGEEI